ncbi:MAG: RusA family crossover junction endodeoxyribonuclease [Gemmatimonadaceae bacterium]|nr:RusA family crossover junction endodeoxyribonuclease [Gemmatimonadaceae bacterium]
MSKARPRVTRFGTYMPKPYMQWRKEFEAMGRQQYPGPPLDMPVSITVVVVTPSGKIRGDLDNVVGAQLDALQPWAITNDRLIQEIHATIAKGPQNISIRLSHISED